MTEDKEEDSPVKIPILNSNLAIDNHNSLKIINKLGSHL